MDHKQTTSSIHVAIVDNDPLAGRALGMLIHNIDPACQIDAIYQQGQEAIDAYTNSYMHDHEPDLMLVDLEMPIIDGVDVCQQIRHLTAHTGILIVTAFATERNIYKAIEAGAQGLIYKDADTAQLLNAIHLVSRGLPVSKSFETTQAAHQRLQATSIEDPQVLSPTQQRIVQLYAQGATTAAIAHQLGNAQSSVKEQMKRAMAKFNVHTRTELIALCVQRKLI